MRCRRASRGPDGALYVAELVGGSYSPGHARVWRVVPGHAPRVWARGLTTVQACGFGRDGVFYATEFKPGGLNEGPAADPAGDVVRIGQHGHRTHLGAGKLFFRSGFAAGRHCAIYVSNCSIAPARAWARSCARPVVRWSASGSRQRRCRAWVALSKAPCLGQHRLGAVAVTGIPAVAAGRVIPRIALVLIQLPLQRVLGDHLVSFPTMPPSPLPCTPPVRASS